MPPRASRAGGHPRWIRGPRTTSTQPSTISTGTIASNADDGSRAAAAHPRCRRAANRCRAGAAGSAGPRARGGSRSRPDSDPGTSPIVFDTLAVTGGMPNASRVGNVISVPDPTTVLMVPAATPASRMATISRGLTGAAGASPRRGHPGLSAGGRVGVLQEAGRPLRGPTPRLRRSPSGPRAWVSASSDAVRCCGSGSMVGSRPACADRRPFGMPATSCTAEPRPSSALVISEGTTQTLLARALGDLRHHLEVLVGQQRLVGLPVVDRLEHRLDRLALTLRLEDRRLAVGLGTQDQRLPVTLGGEDGGLLVALGGEDRRLPLALGGEDRPRACRGRRASASPSSP